MRPYQLLRGGLWVDLDTVQAISPPKILEYIIVLRWQHAFQNERSEERFCIEDFRAPNDEAWEREQRRRLELKLAQVNDEVFVPFLRAWAQDDRLLSPHQP